MNHFHTEYWRKRRNTTKTQFRLERLDNELSAVYTCPFTQHQLANHFANSPNDESRAIMGNSNEATNAMEEQIKWCLHLPTYRTYHLRRGSYELHIRCDDLPPTISFSPIIRPDINLHPAFRRSRREGFYGGYVLAPVDMDTIDSSMPSLPARLADGESSPDLAATDVSSNPTLQDVAKLISNDQAFENTSTSVAASQMRNALNNLADTVTDPTEKKVRQSRIYACSWASANNH